MFRGLLKGSYAITVTTGGSGFSPSGFILSSSGHPIAPYLSGGYGQRRPGGPLQTIDLAEGERIGDAVIRLWKGGAVNGTIYDEAAEPLVGVVVSAVRRSTDGRLLTGPTTSTDDRGKYHLGTLVPGEYLIVVPQTSVLMPSSTVETLVDPKAGLQLALQLGANGAPVPSVAGVRIGDTVITTAAQKYPSALANVLPPLAVADRAFVYQTIFYQSATSTRAALAIRLAAGEEREGLDIQLRPVRAVEVAGSLVDANGPVPNFGVHLLPADSGDGASLLEVAATATDALGRFTFSLVPAGQYTLLAQKVMPVAANNGVGGPPPAAGPPIAEAALGSSATQALTVGDQNVSGLTLSLRAGVRITGRAEFQGSSPQPDAARLNRLQIEVVRAEPLFRSAPIAPRGIVDGSGQFIVPGVPAGPHFIRIPDAPPWSLQSLTVDGRDAVEAPLTVGANDIGDIAIIFTDRPAELSGSVRDGSGVVAPNASVFIFPRDRSRWRSARVATRTVRALRVSRLGTFLAPNIIPGDYFVVAAPDDVASDWPDQELLARLAAAATSVRIDAGQKQTVTLKTAVIR